MTEENVTIETGREPPQEMITATAPNAANRSLILHARKEVIAPPSDMPVAYTRRASTQRRPST